MRSQVPLLVLAHLGLALTACGGAIEDDSSLPSVTSSDEVRCKTSTDCAEGETCTPARDPTGETIYVCRERRITLGRPLVVDGVMHVAPYAEMTPSRTASDEEIAMLLDAAREEHASIAAFARTIAELMALGAPLTLLQETQAALGDEIRHTSMSLAMLEKLTGETRSIAPLEAATLPLRRSVTDFFRDVLRGGAIGETLAAAEAETRRERAPCPALRSFYGTIMHDEARHAALAFKTLRWLLEVHPELEEILMEERAGLSLEVRTLTAPLFAAI